MTKMCIRDSNCVLQGIEREFTTADTVAMARFLLPGLNRFKLDTVAKAVGVSLENHHRAVDDAGCTAEIFVKFVKMLEEQMCIRDSYKRYGLDKPMMERYVITMKGICKGEFGESVVYAGQTVQKLIHDRLPVSARLGICLLYTSRCV